MAGALGLISDLLTRAARKAGFEIFARKSMPYGCDFILDIQRLSRAWALWS